MALQFRITWHKLKDLGFLTSTFAIMVYARGSSLHTRHTHECNNTYHKYAPKYRVTTSEHHVISSCAKPWRQMWRIQHAMIYLKFMSNIPCRIRSVNPHHSATTISKTKLLEKRVCPQFSLVPLPLMSLDYSASIP
jgi:hypothetical protein